MSKVGVGIALVVLSLLLYIGKNEWVRVAFGYGNQDPRASTTGQERADNIEFCAHLVAGLGFVLVFAGSIDNDRKAGSLRWNAEDAAVSTTSDGGRGS